MTSHRLMNCSVIRNHFHRLHKVILVDHSVIHIRSKLWTVLSIPFFFVSYSLSTSFFRRKNRVAHDRRLVGRQPHRPVSQMPIVAQKRFPRLKNPVYNPLQTAKRLYVYNRLVCQRSRKRKQIIKLVSVSD